MIGVDVHAIHSNVRSPLAHRTVHGESCVISNVSIGDLYQLVATVESR